METRRSVFGVVKQLSGLYFILQMLYNQIQCSYHMQRNVVVSHMVLFSLVAFPTANKSIYYHLKCHREKTSWEILLSCYRLKSLNDLFNDSG